MILGLDLAGSPKRNTGFAFFNGSKIMVGIVKEDEEILQLIDKFQYIFIDAPLSLPKGRDSVEDRNGPHLRECDKLLKSLGIKFFPITLGPMRLLTRRALRIKVYAESKGKRVYEVFPGAFYDMFGVSRKDRKTIIHLYKELGYKLERREYTQDELDAVACLITGDMYMKGMTLELKGEDGIILIPKGYNFLT